MGKLHFILGVLLLSFFVSCDENGVDECQRASLTIVTETRDIKDFDGVVFNTVGNVFLTQGPDFAFKITGPENVVELTTSTIENNLLVIGSDACFNGSYDLNVEITAPEYTDIRLTGVGDIKTVGLINGDIINFEMLGIGKIDAQVNADSMTTTIAGTGEVIYKGSVIKHELTCAGKYELRAYELESDRTYINLSGLGDSYVMVNEMLNVTISGTGNVYYKGSPGVDSKIIGTGSVIDSN
jgi:hypothetical protein